MSKELGNKAEARVARNLKKQGYKILHRNWQTPACEIDVVASKGNALFFIEVKYRSGDEAGTGLEYITGTKLKQMQKATEIWVHVNEYEGEYQLAAIEVSGSDFKIGDLVLL